MSNVTEDLKTIENQLNNEPRQKEIMDRLKESIKVLLNFTKKDDVIYKTENNKIELNEFDNFLFH